jgi:hypothetical protein
MMSPRLRHAIISLDSNVVRVDFSRKPEPPAPTFPGAGALRNARFARIPTEDPDMTMKEDRTLRLISGHRANLDRYARLLAGNLTELERQYIHRRIAEEHRTITKLEAQRLATRVAAAADADTLIAARQAARDLRIGLG